MDRFDALASRLHALDNRADEEYDGEYADVESALERAQDEALFGDPFDGFEDEF